MMLKRICSALGGAALMLIGSQAFAAPVPVTPVDCTAFTSTATGYNQCVGLFSDNTSLASANAAWSDDPVYSIEYKDGPNGAAPNSPVFNLLSGGGNSVTLTFLQQVGDGASASLIGLKFGGAGVNQLGYFRFDNASFGIGQVLTFSWSPSFQGDGISHATLYSNSVVPGGGGFPTGGTVPEPATFALLLAGLAGLGVASRRSKPG